MQNTEALIFVFSIQFLIHFSKKPMEYAHAYPWRSHVLIHSTTQKLLFNTVGK